MDKTQLPAEVENEIWEKAKAYAKMHGRKEIGYYSLNYQAGATEYATKLYHVEQEIAELKRWKNEATELLAPILEYGQSKEAGIPLGESITNTVLDRCKQADKARSLLEKFISRHEAGLLPDRFIYEEIKTFLYGTK